MRSYDCEEGHHGGPHGLASRALIPRLYCISILISCLSTTSESSILRDRRSIRMRTVIEGGRPALTPDTYPLPGDQEKCGSNYLKLNFVCDPESLLSHTEAVIINRTLGRKFYHCFGTPVEIASMFGAKDVAGEDEEIYGRASKRGGNGESVRDDAARNRNTDVHRHTHKCIQKRFYTVGIALGMCLSVE